MNILLKPLAVAAMLTATMIPAHAATSSELPDCNNPTVLKALQGIVGGSLRGQAKDLKSDTDKRWCTASANVYLGQEWASTARMWFDKYEPRDVVYTIEWINQAEGRFWVGTK